MHTLYQKLCEWMNIKLTLAVAHTKPKNGNKGKLTGIIWKLMNYNEMKA